MKSNEVIGYVAVSHQLDEIEIEDISIAKLHRKKGMATALLTELVKKAKSNNIRKILLEVAIDNQQAVSFYQKYNFIKTGVRKNYYRRSDGSFVDAWLMDKDLIDV